MKEIDRNKHNYKLTDEDKKEIVLSHYFNNSQENIESLAKKYSVSTRTIANVCKNGRKDIEQSITDNKSNFSKKIDLIIDKALAKINKQLDSDEKVTYKDLAVMIGTLYDKARLEQNLSTSNNAIEVKITIEK